MNENIDLTKILKDCPKGWKLYCSIYGEVEFVCIDEYEEYPIKVMVKRKFIDAFSRKGFIRPQYNIKGILFPSKDQIDWSKFTAPWYKKEKFDPNTLKPFDKVLVKLSNDDVWIADFFSYYDKLEKYMKYVCITHLAVFCIPYNDDTKHLLGTNKEAPEFYKYWDD